MSNTDPLESIKGKIVSYLKEINKLKDTRKRNENEIYNLRLEKDELSKDFELEKSNVLRLKQEAEQYRSEIIELKSNLESARSQMRSDQ